MDGEPESDRRDLDHDATTEILRAASQHNLSRLKQLLRGSSSGPANVQGSNKQTPLHEAIAACEHSRTAVSAEGTSPNKSTPGLTLPPPVYQAAVETVQLLLYNGAIWNSLDDNDETPGCIACRLGLVDLYQVMVDAGVRAEMLLNHLSESTTLEGGEIDDDEPWSVGSVTSSTPGENRAQYSGQGTTLQGNGTVPAAMGNGSVTAAGNSQFLRSRLHYDGNHKLVDGRNNLAVMMSWEADIMKQSARKLTEGAIEHPRVLNIGHGLGIIDEEFQSMMPSSHHIIEAHHDVQTQMQASGWYSRPGIRVHEGRWQDVVPKLVEQGLLFDAIYFDTYAEDYQAFKLFFDTHLVALLADDGKFGFFNGLGADRQICHDVYQNIVEMDLLEAGFEATFTESQTPSALHAGTWEGLTRPYWRLRIYRLPVVEFSRA